jgi:cytochrome c biogenesis protein CcmG/thiol:disulfide interchange protein DsbE
MRLRGRLALALWLGALAGASAAAPFQSARTLGGDAFDPTGHVTIVNYWATWCAPCRAEMPIFDAYYRRHQREGLAMVAISLDTGISSARLKRMTQGYAFPIARIGEVDVPRRDIPVALPVTRIYDKAGRLRFQTRGDGRTSIDAATLEKVVTPLLAER